MRGGGSAVRFHDCTNNANMTQMRDLKDMVSVSQSLKLFKVLRNLHVIMINPKTRNFSEIFYYYESVQIPKNTNPKVSHAVFSLYGSGTSRRHCPIVLCSNLKIIAKYVRGTSVYIVQCLFDKKLHG